jgi:phosphopentomutase
MSEKIVLIVLGSIAGVGGLPGTVSYNDAGADVIENISSKAEKSFFSAEHE